MKMHLNLTAAVFISLIILVMPSFAGGAGLGSSHSDLAPITDARVDDSSGASRDITDWTFMVYMDGDNNLEKFAINDFNEMENVGSSANLNIVVEFDRTPGYDTSNGDWTDTRRYRVTSDNTYDASANSPDRTIRSQLVSDIGEQNMASESTFEDFLYWAIGNYTARNYMLMMWDHGSGIFRSQQGVPQTRGCCLDSTDGGELKLWDMSAAMKRVESYYNMKINITGFDVCYLGNWETVYELKDLTDYVIASADEEPDEGWEYTTPLNIIQDNPTITPYNFSIRAVNYYMSLYTSVDYVTLSAVSVSEFNNYMLQDLNDFANYLSYYMYPYRYDIKDIRNSTDWYYGESVDLGDFASRIAAREGLPQTLRGSANDLLSSMEQAVIAKGSGVKHRNYYTGNAIYFPRYNYDTTYTNRLSFSSEQWDDFLDVFLHPERISVYIDHTPLRDREDIYSGALVSAKITGRSLDKASPTLHYSFGDEFIDVTMSELDSTYTAVIPGPGKVTDVFYYISAEDNLGNTTTFPEGADPAVRSTVLSFHVGPDTIAPVITHIPYKNTMDTTNDYEITATVSDNIAVDPDGVQLHWWRVFNAADLNESHRNGNETIVQMSPTSVNDWNEGVYTAFIPNQPMGTRVYYYITANDTASATNTARLPEEDAFTFLVKSPYGSILVDYGHGNVLEGYNSSSIFLDLDRYVVDFYVSSPDVQPLTYSLLSSYDMFISIRPSSMFTQAEKTAIIDWLSDGGAFILVPGSDINVLSNILLDLSYGIHKDDSLTSEQIDIPDDSTDPLTHGLDYVYVNYQRNGEYYLDSPEGATDHLVSQKGPVCSSVRFGKGQGIFMFLHDGIVNYPYVTLYSYNAQFASRIIPWMLSNMPPKSSFTADKTSVKPGYTINFTATSTDEDGYISNFTWMLDDGRFFYGKNITVNFSTPGWVNITLITTDNDGATSTAYSLVKVQVPPEAHISTAYGVGKTLYTLTDAKFESTSVDEDGHIVSWLWDFGDGSNATGESVLHQWKRPGTYTVTLKVTDNDGLTDSTSIVISIKNRAPRADFSFNVSTTPDGSGQLYKPEMDKNGVYYILEDQLIILNGTLSSDDDSRIINYTWDWGDGTQSFGVMGEHYYTKYDIYEVNLVVVDEYNDQDVKSIKFSVTNPAPDVEVKWDINGLNTHLYFTLLSDTESDKDNLSIVWDLGDGTIVKNKTSLDHRYASGGKYIITVTVTDDEGAYNMTKLEMELKPSLLESVFGDAAPYVQALMILIVIGLLGSWVYEVVAARRKNGEKPNGRCEKKDIPRDEDTKTPDRKTHRHTQGQDKARRQESNRRKIDKKVEEAMKRHREEP